MEINGNQVEIKNKFQSNTNGYSFDIQLIFQHNKKGNFNEITMVISMKY